MIWPLRPVCSSRLALATYSSPDPLTPGHLSGKAPPYLSSLATITKPTRSMRSSRYISLVIPKANTSFGRLSVQFSADKDWKELQKSLKLETYSLTNFQCCQLSDLVAVFSKYEYLQTFSFYSLFVSSTMLFLTPTVSITITCTIMQIS